MIWTVVWLDSAQDHLAHLWIYASDRNPVALAANRIDELLRRDPYAVGESRSGVNRVFLEQPLGISYDVSDEDRLVTVLAVWRTN